MTAARPPFLLPERVQPIAHSDGLDEPFWSGLRTEKIVLQYCPACSAYQWGPEYVCYVCGTGDLAWAEVPNASDGIRWIKTGILKTPGRITAGASRAFEGTMPEHYGERSGIASQKERVMKLWTNSGDSHRAGAVRSLDYTSAGGPGRAHATHRGRSMIGPSWCTSTAVRFERHKPMNPPIDEDFARAPRAERPRRRR